MAPKAPKAPGKRTAKSENPRGRSIKRPTGKAGKSGKTDKTIKIGKTRKTGKAVGRRVWHHEGEPIEDANQLPEGWSANEPDLDENDIDGQIERCHERIKEGILPSLFEGRLAVYTEAKKKRNKILEGEPEGLSWDVYRRLNGLKFIKRNLTEKDGSDEKLQNVEAIMEAYRSGKLTWTPGLVTYWARGTQLSQPKEFDGDECDRIGRQYGEGFWVEGLDGPGPIVLAAAYRWTEAPINELHQHNLTIALRVAGTNRGYRTFDMLDDTGATNMLLYQADLVEIQTACGSSATYLNDTFTSTVNGPTSVQTHRLEANIFDADNEEILDNWVPVTASIKPGSQQTDGGLRLSGMWLRHVLFTGTCPDVDRREIDPPSYI